MLMAGVVARCHGVVLNPKGTEHVMRIVPFLVAALLLTACSASPPPFIPVDHDSVAAGSSVLRGNDRLDLQGTPIRVGEPLPEIALVDSNLRPVALADLRGEVLLISVVPSLDTRVCERQTHILGEMAGELPDGVRRITISRDLPFAQQRFADDTGFGDILFLSDYADARFGRATGLLVDRIALLARSAMVVDREGVVRYLQVVPQLIHLPDLDRAADFARTLAEAD